MTVDLLERSDGITWKAHAHVDKFSSDQEHFALKRAQRAGGIVFGPRGRVANLGALMAQHCGDPELGTADAAGNILVTVGLSLITNLLIGGTTAGSIKNVQAICGVGATATAANVADTALGANGGSAWYQAADATFPSRSSGVMTMQSTFSTSNGNFAWAEWCWASCTSGSVTGNATLASVATGCVMWNHKIASLGTKTSAASWVFTTTVTLS